MVNTTCQHQTLVTAKDVFVHVTGKEGDKHRELKSSPITLRHHEVVFCANPTCEKVFHAEPVVPMDPWREETYRHADD